MENYYLVFGVYTLTVLTFPSFIGTWNVAFFTEKDHDSSSLEYSSTADRKEKSQTNEVGGGGGGG